VARSGDRQQQIRRVDPPPRSADTGDNRNEIPRFADDTPSDEKSYQAGAGYVVSNGSSIAALPDLLLHLIDLDHFVEPTPIA
jgi:hypothetical protein